MQTIYIQEIYSKLRTKEDIINRTPKLFDPENLVCVASLTHKAIHYGDRKLLPKPFIIRTKNDTCPWKL